MDQRLPDPAVTDWRGLCEELYRAFTAHARTDKQHDLLDRARAALAQLEPEVRELSDQELDDLADATPWHGSPRRFGREVARAAIAADRARWGRPAPAPAGERQAALAAEADGPAVQSREPASVVGEPSDDDLALIYYDCCGGCEFMDQGDFEDAARAVLARWGRPAPVPAGEVAELVEWLRDRAESVSIAQNALRITRAADLLERQAAPVPVAVSERLPGPEDCDVEFGALCDHIEVQLQRQGFTLGDRAPLFQRWAGEINSLRIHGLLNESESDRARKRLWKELTKSVKPLPSVEPQP